MKRFLKNVLSVITGMAVLTGMVTGCGSVKKEAPDTVPKETTESVEAASNFNETGLPIVNEPVTLSVLVETSPLYPITSDLWYFQEMERLTGIHWEIESVDSEQWKERKSLIFASQDLPDIIISMNLTPSDIITYANAGQILPLNDLLDSYAPNYMALLNEFRKAENYMRLMGICTD